MSTRAHDTLLISKRPIRGGRSQRLLRLFVVASVLLTTDPVPLWAASNDSLRPLATREDPASVDDLTQALLLGPEAHVASQNPALMGPLGDEARARIQAGHLRRETGPEGGQGEWLTLILHGKDAKSPEENLALLKAHYASFQTTQPRGSPRALSAAEETFLLDRLRTLTNRPAITDRHAGAGIVSEIDPIEVSFRCAQLR